MCVLPPAGGKSSAAVGDVFTCIRVHVFTRFISLSHSLSLPPVRVPFPQVLGVSVDSKFAHYHFSKAERKDGGLGGCKYPLIADITKEISKMYEVLIEEGDDAGLSARGLFIISDKGILRQKTVNDLPVGRDVDETIRLIQAFKYTDTHGEVCPAGWRPGKPTMVDDPKKSLEYFSKVN